MSFLNVRQGPKCASEIKGSHVHGNQNPTGAWKLFWEGLLNSNHDFSTFEKAYGLADLFLWAVLFLKSQINSQEFEILPCDVIVMWKRKIILLKWQLQIWNFLFGEKPVILITCLAYPVFCLE